MVKRQSINIYPNPVTDSKINLVIKDDDTNTYFIVKLLDSQQSELFSQAFETLQRSGITINLPEYVVAGIYFLKIANPSGIYYKKVIVK